MSEAQEALFEAVRAACKPAVWSRGVELSRAEAVSAVPADDPDEASFLVAQRSGMVARRVRLYLDDIDWDCDCSIRDDACDHVAAAVIAWQRAAEQGDAMPAGSAAGRLAYRFRRQDGGLALERAIEHGGGDYTVVSTLAALSQGRVAGPRFVAGQADLAVELALGTHRRGLLARQDVTRLLKRLVLCDRITLDGLPVRVSADPVGPLVVLTDQDEGFRLTLGDDPAVTESFRNGVSLCGDTLRPTAEPRIDAREARELPRGRYFGRADVSRLVTEILPDLRRRMRVEVRTDRLPETRRMTARINFDLSGTGDELDVLPTMVYGDPPAARVDAGHLVSLGGAVPLRDEAAEKRLARRLQRELGLVPGVRQIFRGDAAVAMADRVRRWGEGFDRKVVDRFRVCAALQPRLELDGSHFEVRFETPTDSESSEAGAARAEDVLRAWRAGESLVPLLDGGWSALPRDWLARVGDRLADLLAARDATGALPKACLPDLARLHEASDLAPPPSFDGLRVLVDSFEQIPAARLPSDLTAELREYQRRGVDWLVFLRDAGLGGLLADDMGLGKTLQALCALRGRTLVVAPTSVLHNWAAEIERFRPSLTVDVYHGPARALRDDVDVTLTTYALLRLDVEPLCATGWDTVILDEAQAIKNPDSQVSAAAFRLRGEFRITLTGTPVENRLEELWSQFHFSNRGLLGERDDFVERYAGPICAGDAAVAQRLHERIRPFLLRRMKREVAPELPPRTDLVVRCELDTEERRVYDAIRAATRRDVVSRLQEGGSVLAALEALLRLRQAACHAGLVPGQSFERSSKLALLLELLDSAVAEGHKMVVFSQWTSLLDLTEPLLRQSGIEFVRLDGATRDRGGVVSKFQSADGPPLMLASLKAGGTGLNLTAADHIYLLDPWWNPAVEDQAADRAHRIGQQRPVMVYRLVAEATVEERILDLQQSKRRIAEAALAGTAGAAGLTRDDLLALLD